MEKPFNTVTPGSSEGITYLDSSYLRSSNLLMREQAPFFERRGLGWIDQDVHSFSQNFPNYILSLISKFRREESSQRLRHSLDVLQTLVGSCHH
jgi:hypothetical protein